MEDLNKLSNAELKLQLKRMEDDYEVLKNQINRNLERMEVLDKEYIKTQEVFQKRTRGKV